MRKSIHGGALLSAILFLICVVLLMVYVEFLPLWMTDPYTYSAYKESRQVLYDLQEALDKHAKMYGMPADFSEFSTFYNLDKQKDNHLHSFESMAYKGAVIGSVDMETRKFTPRDLDSHIIEIRWKNRNVTATYTLKGTSISGQVYAIFNLGKVIDRVIEEDSL